MVTNSNKTDTEVAEGDSVTGVVIFVDSQARVVELGCQPELVSQVEARTKKVAKVGANLRGRVVMNKTEHGVCLVLVTYPKSQAGMLGFAATKRHHNDLAGAGVEDSEQGKPVALVVQEVNSRGEVVLLLKIEVRRAEAKLGKRNRSLSQSEDVKIKRKRTSECEMAPSETKQSQEIEETPGEDKQAEKSGKKKRSKKRKRKDSEKGQTVEEVEEDDSSSSSNKAAEKEVEPVRGGDSGEMSSEPIKPELSDPGWDLAATCITVPAWQAASIWSDDELGEEEEAREKTHISKAEVKRLRLLEEERAAAREQRVLDGEVESPSTVEEFERLVVASPDSSLVWVQYMALVMQSGELESARALATRALQRINFRLEEERLNIFLAWLNLENTFGTEEAMAGVLKEALQCCDQFKVYSQVAAIYQQAGNFSQAEKTFKLLSRKFNKEKEVWIKFGIFYYKNNKLSDGRFILQRS